MVKPHHELIAVIGANRRGGPYVGTYVGLWPKREGIGRHQINPVWRKRILGEALSGSRVNRFDLLLRKIATSDQQGWHGCARGYSMALAKSFVAHEEEGPVLDDRPNERGPKLILFQGRNRRCEEVARVEHVIAQEVVEATMKIVSAALRQDGDD